MSGPNDTRVGRWRSRRVSASNLRPAPTWVTPALVGRVLEVIQSPPAMPAPVHSVPVPAAPPALRIVETEKSILRSKPQHHLPQAEMDAFRIAFERGIAIYDLAAALGRKQMSVSKYATKLGLKFGRRSLLLVPITLDGILELADRNVPVPPTKADGRLADAADRRTARRTRAWHRSDEFVTAVTIAHRRGIAAKDVATAIGRGASSVVVHARTAGMPLGKQPPLADPLTIDQLLALADDSIPLPELKRERLHRQRLDRASELRRNRRLIERADDPTFKPLGKRNTPGTSGTARKAPGVTVSAVASRDSVSVSLTQPVTAAVAQPSRPRPAPTDSPVRAAISVPTLPVKLPTNPFAYAEAINNAKRYLESRHCTVRKLDRDAVFAKWTVTGFSGSFDNAELVQLACDLQARASA